MTGEPFSGMEKIYVATDSPACRLAGKWRKAFANIVPQKFEIQWMFLSRPLDFWNKRMEILQLNPKPLLISLGWFSTVLTRFWLPKCTPLVPVDIMNREDWVIDPILSQSRAQIHLLSSSTPQVKNIGDTPGFHVVCIADMSPGSGAFEALWAFTMVRLAGWPCTLWMAGEGPLLKEIQSFANLASIPEDIRFIPNFRSEDSLPVIPDLYLIPSGSETDNLATSPQTAASRPHIIAAKKNHSTSANLSAAISPAGQIAIPWKPHHICRVIMECLTQLNRFESQACQPKQKNLSSILLAIAKEGSQCQTEPVA